MKRILFLTISMLMVAAQLWAASIKQSVAQDRALAFLNSHTSPGKILSPRGKMGLQLVATANKLTSEPAYYVFNANDAFVIVAGDDRARQILAYGDQPIDMDALPANMRYWLSCYERQMAFLMEHPDLQLPPFQASGETVQPMISANWSQLAPYWNECPVFGTDTCYTGCPATSLSMVFHYWKYPKQQTPAVPSYMIPTYGVTLPELPPTIFDWDNMLDNYTGNYNETQGAAVAHLMRYIGQIEEMDYTISGSGAYLKDILRAVKFFEYDQNAQMLFKSDELGYVNYTDDQWAALIQNELQNGRPIVYCAYDNTTGSGHAFNVDGYDAATGEYHINWGWNGRGNGHYALNAFSYGDYTFGTAQQMIIGIQPPEDYLDPRLQAYPSTVNMQAYPGKPATTTITLKGTNLTDDVTLTVDDPDGVFDIGATTLARAEVEAGKEITVTYSPQAVSTSTATVICQSQGANVLTLTLNGDAPLEVHQPEMKPARGSWVTLTSFRADWADITPRANVVSYTLEVREKPDYILLEEADFSDLPRIVPTNQASHASDYLPEGWSFSGSEFNLEGGCIMPRRNGVITTDALSLSGYDKVTVVVTGRSYDSYGYASELTISTGKASQTIELPFGSYGPTAVVLDCDEGSNITFTAGYYPKIQKIEIYAGEYSASASEAGEGDVRLFTGITDKYYNVTQLMAGGTYFYRVKALYIDNTESEWSNTQIVTLVDGGYPDEHDYPIGDVNHNGVVGIDDVTALIDYMLDRDAIEICDICADVNNDTAIDIADVTSIIDLILGNY